MIEVNGTFDGEVTVQTAVAIPDKPLHCLAIGTVSGVHKSDDGHWSGAEMTYWGMGDLLAGNGAQTGYFRNQHVSGDTTFGTFDGNVTMDGLASKIVGKWQLVSGTGTLEGISGGGRFEAHSTDPVHIHMDWSGEYSLRSQDEVVVQGPLEAPRLVNRT
jgi:hypothetical protein